MSESEDIKCTFKMSNCSVVARRGENPVWQEADGSWSIALDGYTIIDTALLDEFPVVREVLERHAKGWHWIKI